jgi:phosphoglycolate phosphatase
MSETQIDVIIWDWNGTLLDDIHISLETINTLLSERGLALLNEERYREVFTFPVKDYYLKIGFDFSIEPFDIPARKFIDIYNIQIRNCGLFPEALSVLDQYKQNGLQQFILSAMEQEPLEDTIRRNKIFSFFDGVYGLDNHYAHSKIEIGKKLITENRLNPERVVVIGDTVHDYEVAKELGCRSILVANGHQSGARLEKTGTRIVETLGEIEGVKFKA